MDNPFLTSYRLAFEKRAGLGALAKGFGGFMGSLPFWIAGGSLTERLLGKKPQEYVVRIPRAKYERIVAERRAGGMRG